MGEDGGGGEGGWWLRRGRVRSEEEEMWSANGSEKPKKRGSKWNLPMMN